MRQVCCICSVPCGGDPLSESCCSAPTVKRCTSCAAVQSPPPHSFDGEVTEASSPREAVCPLARGSGLCTGHYYCCNCSGDPFLERRLPGKEEMASSCKDEKKCWHCRERAAEACSGHADSAPHQRARRGSAPDPAFGSLHRHFSACTVGRHINKKLSFRADLDPSPVLWRVHEEGPEAELLHEGAGAWPALDSAGRDMDGFGDEFCNQRWMGGLQWEPAQCPPESMTLDWGWDPTPLEASTGGWVVYRSGQGSADMDPELSETPQQSPMDFRSALSLQAHTLAAAEPHATLGGKRPRAADAPDPEATPPAPPSPFVLSEYSPSPVPARLFFPTGCDESMPDWGDAACAAGKRHASGDGGSPFWAQAPWPRACDVV